MSRAILIITVVVFLAVVLAFIAWLPRAATLSPTQLHVGTLPGVPDVPLARNLRVAGPEDLDIFEAVFWYRIRQHGSKGPFFLSIHESDPSEAFMQRFARYPSSVKRRSEGFIPRNAFPITLLDRATGRPGVELSVKSPVWISPSEVEVEGGMYCGGLCADGGTYRLSKRNGQWMVDAYKVAWVS